VVNLLSKKCCNRSCVTCFKKLSVVDIEGIRSDFYGLSTETTQNQFYLRRHSDCSGSVASGKFEKGVVQIEHGRQGRESVREPSVRGAMWLRMFVDKIGDHMPTDGTIHLPSCLTKSDV